MDSKIVGSLNWGDVWLHELLYGTEKAAMREAEKVETIRGNIESGLVGAYVEIEQLDQRKTRAAGILTSFNLLGCIISIGAGDGVINVPYGKVERERDWGNSQQPPHAVALISMSTETPYKY